MPGWAAARVADRGCRRADAGAGQFRCPCSTLAFELVSGRQPVIVLGRSGGAFGPGAAAGRATASHSTLSLTGYASARLARGGDREVPEKQEFRLGPRDGRDAAGREEGRRWPRPSPMTGWRRTHGLVHLRSLQLGPRRQPVARRGRAGRDDRYATVPRWPGACAPARRHRVALRRAVSPPTPPMPAPRSTWVGTAVSIQLPGRETWVFRYGGEAVLDARAFGRSGRRTGSSRARQKQIVLTGPPDRAMAAPVSWTLARPVGLSGGTRRG